MNRLAPLSTHHIRCLSYSAHRHVHVQAYTVGAPTLVKDAVWKELHPGRNVSLCIATGKKFWKLGNINYMNGHWHAQYVIGCINNASYIHIKDVPG